MFKFSIFNFQFSLGIQNLSLLFLLILSLIPLLDLFHSGLPLTHDGQDHVARIANFYQSLSEGNLVPRWAQKLNWGYGHPILMFLYPLPSYIASLFHFLGFSLTDSLKIVLGLSFIASGIAMYIWIRSFLGEKEAVLSSVLYMFAPYRFVDLYVRGAIGEHVAFVFLPLILYFLLKLSKKYNYWYIVGGSFSLAGLILSHNAISIMFLPFIILYGVYLVSLSKVNKLIYQYASILVLGFGLSSFFLLPAFFEGKYTLRDIVTANEYVSRFVPLNKFFDPMWSYGGSGQLSVFVGFAQLISLMLFPMIIVFYKFITKVRPLKKEMIILALILFLYTFISFFLMLNESNILYLTFTTLQKFQFPWRFMSVIVFTAAVLGGFVLYLIKNNKFKVIFFVLLATAALFTNREYWRANGFLQRPDSFYKSVYYGTTDTGESAPIWSVRFMEKIPKDTIEVVEGGAMIKKISRKSTHHKYEIESIHSSRIRENTLYFPGWKVYVDGKETKEVQFQDPNHRGLMTFYLKGGKHIIDVVFEETMFRKISNIVSAVSFTILILFSLKRLFWEKFFRNLKFSIFNFHKRSL